MIESFQHKGLEAFYKTGSTKGVQTGHAKKLRRILAVLDAARNPMDVKLPGFGLHQLKGKMEGFWSVSVNGNWRVIFRFTETGVELVDYLDYH